MTDSERKIVEAADVAIKTAARQAGQVDTIDERVDLLCKTVHDDADTGEPGIASKVETLYKLEPVLQRMAASQLWQEDKMRQLIRGGKRLLWVAALGAATSGGGAIVVKWHDLVTFFVGKT